jgi:hypothetical protein
MVRNSRLDYGTILTYAYACADAAWAFNMCCSGHECIRLLSCSAQVKHMGALGRTIHSSVRQPTSGVCLCVCVCARARVRVCLCVRVVHLPAYIPKEECLSFDRRNNNSLPCVWRLHVFLFLLARVGLLFFFYAESKRHCCAQMKQVLPW